MASRPVQPQVKKWLLLALPFGSIALLALWLWSRSSKTIMNKSSGYAIGATVTNDQGTFTKQSDAAQVPDGTPGAVEIWTDGVGGSWTPSLAFSQGNSGPAFQPLAS